MLVPLLLIVLFAAVVTGLIAIGWRLRPGLEIPPRAWPLPELTPSERRRRLRLQLAGGITLWAGVLGSVALRAMDLRVWGIVVLLVAVSAYLGSVVARMALSYKASRTHAGRSDPDRGPGTS